MKSSDLFCVFPGAKFRGVYYVGLLTRVLCTQLLVKTQLECAWKALRL